MLSSDSFPGFSSQRRLPTISRIMAPKMPRASGSSSNHPLSTTTTATTDLKGQSGISSTLLLLRDRSIRIFPCSQTELLTLGRHLRDRQEDSPFSRQGESENLRKMKRFLDILSTRKTVMRKKLLKLKNIIIIHHSCQKPNRETIIQIHFFYPLVQKEVVMHHWETSSEILIKMRT